MCLEFLKSLVLICCHLVIEASICSYYSLFFLFNIRGSPVYLTKFLTLPLEQQTSGLKSTEFLFQQKCLHVICSPLTCISGL